MTQNANDVEIANQGFAAFRQDLNDVLEDITTLHSGTAAPSTTYANQWWYETDTDKLYIRNEDNDAWIEILTLDQANDHLATLGATITLDGSGNASIDGTFDVNGNELILDADGDTSITADTDDQIDFKTGGSDRVTIDSSGRVGIGTSTPSQKLDVSGAGARIYLNDANEDIDMNSTADGQLRLDGSGYAGAIALNTDGMNIYTNASSRGIIFGTNETERMRIDTSGNVLVGTTSNNFNTGLSGVRLEADGSIVARSDNINYFLKEGTGTLQQFRYFSSGTDTSGTTVGSITITTSSTSYNTSSDYRLKENVIGITDGIERVKQLNPSRFNFIADADTTVDGFIAHEAQTVVPEAVTGEKDAMRDEEYEVTPAVLDDDGNVVTEAVMGTRSVPDYQGIDQAKLVPLLTAALQEAIAKIETLETQNADFETRLTALEN